MKLYVKIRKLREDAVIPTYAHETDAGFDLHAAEDVLIEPGETVVVPTGIAIDIPQGFEIQVRPRSGITRKTKLRVQLGTIDAGYHGDIGVIVDNISQPEYDIDGWDDYATIETQSNIFVNSLDGGITKRDRYYPEGTYLIRKGDKIAQAVLTPVVQANFIEVDDFDGESDRGTNGWGSSGVK